MPTKLSRIEAKRAAINRNIRLFERPQDAQGNSQNVLEYYGESVFSCLEAKVIPGSIKNEILEASSSGKKISNESIGIIAEAVTKWAINKGATHFCHWFQPLTGSTAEKHDAFLDFDKSGKPIEKLSISQLMQGEPDASSFPNGGLRSTFEARGYTSWDFSSPMFLMEGVNGKTLCIPTAFVSYTGEALDIKTPLLRSITKLDQVATKLMNKIGLTEVKHVSVTCGAEQEYFLIDKNFYYSRPDLVMTGRTLFGTLSSKNQQLDDHYFGTIPKRVLSFMEELDFELHKLGVPAKTRHNEVAPGQFELAQIFREANVSADNNQLVMAIIKSVAEKHDFVALLHEKPFAGINGSGKHLNWSLSTDTGHNLLAPGDRPHENAAFIAVNAIVIEAVKRHAKLLRAAIASQGNDHRLGANEAPPSIISVFTGSNLETIFKAVKEGKATSAEGECLIDLGANQLASLLRDNTDRNRTSPFAFTGNKFEFRAVGSSSSIGFPLAILNAAVSEVFAEAIEFLDSELKGDSPGDIDRALYALSKKYFTSSWDVIFNGDGYSDEWLKEAKSRGLPNLCTTADALSVLIDPEETNFLTSQKIFSKNELEIRYNVLLERYITLREIEFNTFIEMVNQNVIPAVIEFKAKLGEVIRIQKDINLESSVEIELYKRLGFSFEGLYSSLLSVENILKCLPDDQAERAKVIAHELMPASIQLADACGSLEEILPSETWMLPSYYDMLFLR